MTSPQKAIKNKKRVPYLAALIKKLGPKIGARVLIEPEWGIAGQITYPNKVTRHFRTYSLDLNPIASADIARDKDFAKFFMSQKGYPTAPGVTIFSEAWARAVKSKRTAERATYYAKKLGFPVIAKPNSKSQGAGVCLAPNQKELKHALREIFKSDKVALIEKYLPGRDYRIVVLDGEIISAYERLPLSVTGDGRSSVLSLLKKKQKLFSISGRDTSINFNDKRIKDKLRKQGLVLGSVLPKNHKIFLLDNANLSTGGDAIDVSLEVHPGFAKIAQDLTRDMGLRMAGVDIMIRTGDISQNPNKCVFYIIEINAAPGLDHYVTTGKAQRKKVEDMYLSILKALGKKN